MNIETDGSKYRIEQIFPIYSLSPRHPFQNSIVLTIRYYSVVIDQMDVFCNNSYTIDLVKGGWCEPDFTNLFFSPITYGRIDSRKFSVLLVLCRCPKHSKLHEYTTYRVVKINCINSGYSVCDFGYRKWSFVFEIIYYWRLSMNADTKWPVKIR